MSQEFERELGWDDEIEKDGPVSVLLPEGEYNFTVAGFKRGRFQGSTKMPPCNEAILELKVHSPEHGDVTVFDRLFLHTKTEGFLSNFFTGIGQKKPGEKLKMNWNSVVGSTGRLKIEHNKFKKDNGEERVNNQVETYLPYDEYLKHAGQQQSTQQQAPAQNQTPFPGAQQQPNQQQQGGFVPGQF